MSGRKEQMSFQAETVKLLELMIHSLYSNKEVFLRELISNASDAIDKRRFEALTDEALAAGFEGGEIRLRVDEAARTLTVTDNGIGMSRREVIDNIGTIARSGTQELMRALEEAKNADMPAELIGQFGVGFYSCFMAADRVTLISRRAGTDETTVWTYEGGGEYTVTDGERDEAGTSVTLHLKPADPEDGLEDFTNEGVIRRTVKKYSDFVRHPIVLPVKRGEEGKEEIADETLNSMKALWLRPEAEITDEERNEFYKHVARDWSEPFAHFSLKAEGRLEYQALLFVPSHAPFDLFSQAYEKGLQLYVRNVKIMDRCDELLPDYLRFLKGVVDAQDLPLNVSRELIQNNRHLAQIRAALTKKALDTLKGIQEDEARYGELWKNFGAVIKEGLTADQKNRERILPLLIFASTNDPEKLTTLASYVERIEGGPGAHLLPHRRGSKGAGGLAPPGGLQGQGVRGPPAHRPHRRVHALGPSWSSTEGSSSPRARASWSWTPTRGRRSGRRRRRASGP